MGMSDDLKLHRAVQQPRVEEQLRQPGPFEPPGYAPIPPVFGPAHGAAGDVGAVQPLRAPLSATGGPAGAFLSTMPRGASAGFLDPAAGSSAARRARYDYPLSALAGDVVGAAPAALRGGRLLGKYVDRATQAMTGGNVARPVVKAAAVTPVEGAIFGAGYDPENRARGAAVGAVTGLAGGVGAELATQGIGRGIARLRGRGAETPAERVVRESLEFDTGAEGGALTAAVERRMADLEPDPRLVDVGTATRQQLDQAVASGGGPVRAQVEDELYTRSAGQLANITEPLRRRLAPGGEPFMSTNWDELAEIREQEAIPLYNLAYRRGIPHDDPTLERAFDTPRVQRAWGNVLRLIRDDPTLDPEVLAQVQGPNGRPSLRGWQLIKEQLDDFVEGHSNPTSPTFSREEARSVRGLKDFIVSRLDELQPTYREARSVWAGTKDAEDAMQAGYDFMSTNKLSQYPVSRLARLNENERSFFRIGAASYLNDLLERSAWTHDVSKRFQTPAMRRRLEVVMGSRQDVDDFYQVIDAEAEKQRALKALGGSPTAGRLTEQAVWSDVAADVADLSQTTGFGQAMRLGRRALTEPPMRPPAVDMAGDVARMLIEPDSATRRATVEQLVRGRPMVVPQGYASSLAAGPGTVAGADERRKSLLGF